MKLVSKSMVHRVLSYKTYLSSGLQFPLIKKKKENKVGVDKMGVDEMGVEMKWEVKECDEH